MHICSLTQLLGGFLLIGTNSQKGLTAWDVPLLYDSLDQAACLHTLTSLFRTLPIFNIRTVSVKCYALGLRTCWLQYDSLSFDTLNTAKKIAVVVSGDGSKHWQRVCKCSTAAATLERFSTADSKASSPHKLMLISMTTLCEIIIVPWFGATELTEWFSSCYYCEMSHANSWRYTGQRKCESDEKFLLYDTWKNVLASKNTFAHVHI